MAELAKLVGVVFSGLSALSIEGVEDAGDVIVVRASTRGDAVACPACGTPTGRVHAFHERVPADVPVDGRRVLVRLRIRRMRCPVTACARQTFREQVPGLIDRYQRRTVRLGEQVRSVVRELAGRASSRLLPAIGIVVGRDTAVRVLLGIPLPDRRVPRVLGIDDFALRRCHDYAPVVIDADTGSRIDPSGHTVSAPAGDATPRYARWPTPGPGRPGSSRETSPTASGVLITRSCSPRWRRRSTTTGSFA